MEPASALHATGKQRLAYSFSVLGRRWHNCVGQRHAAGEGQACPHPAGQLWHAIQLSVPIYEAVSEFHTLACIALTIPLGSVYGERRFGPAQPGEDRPAQPAGHAPGRLHAGSGKGVCIASPSSVLLLSGTRQARVASPLWHVLSNMLHPHTTMCEAAARVQQWRRQAGGAHLAFLWAPGKDLYMSRKNESGQLAKGENQRTIFSPM